ncbi:HAD hydrolase-like protein [Maricaulis sp.]|uniref:HAD hydrolase-like protein n=1 Tax=Maricaulis sp. TaxID=1486257 RepID=UPI0025BBBF72|nr:HAD hydrolase-like protein [Maricaulis sp.]
MLDSRDAALFADAAIAFDLDGTLVDTAPDLLRALNAVILPRGLAAVELHAVRAMVGRGARALLERAHASQGRAFENADQAVAEFIEIYRQDVAAHSRAFDGVEATLGWLRSQGSRLSVCTNKPSVLSDMLIGELGLSGYFDRIIGPERTRAKKPAADHLLDALGDGYSRAALVGDSEPDVASAAAAGLPSIVMSYGYSERPADSLGAGRVIHAFSDVPLALAELWRATT